MLARAGQGGSVPSYAGSERAAGQRTRGVQRAGQPAARRGDACAAGLPTELRADCTAAGNGGHARAVVPLLSAAEELPLRSASLDVVSAFNCIHHFALARFLAAAARVLRPDGQLFIYTRTPQQNARTIWGRYFPGFTGHEQRLHSEAVLRDAVRRTGGLTLAATHIFHHPRTSTAGRPPAQAPERPHTTQSPEPPARRRR